MYKPRLQNGAFICGFVGTKLMPALVAAGQRSNKGPAVFGQCNPVGWEDTFDLLGRWGTSRRAPPEVQHRGYHALSLLSERTCPLVGQLKKAKE
jgi:hypothetical protein